MILWISPVLWLSGAYACRGRRQAFFLGGVVAGLAPYLAAVILSIAYYAEWIDDGDWPNILEPWDDSWAAFRVAVAVYMPGVCSLIGGTLAWFAYDYQKRQSDSVARPALAREEAGPVPVSVGEPPIR